MRALLLLVLAACRRDEPDPIRDCTLPQDLGTGALWNVASLPDGTLYASGDSPFLRVRRPNGTWYLDGWERGGAVGALDGGDDGALWGLRHDEVVRRARGSWRVVELPYGVPDPDWELLAFEVHREDDAVLVYVEHLYCYSTYTTCTGAGDTVHLVRWRGASWEVETRPAEGFVYSAVVAEDGAVWLGTSDGVRSLQGGSIPGSAGVDVRSLSRAPDGAFVAAAHGGPVLLGDASGLAVNTPPFEAYWETGLALSASDVWVAGTVFGPGLAEDQVLAQWDGVSWAEVEADGLAQSPTFERGPDGTVFVFDPTHEVVWNGARDGLAVDRARWMTGEPDSLAVDDVTGFAWAVGSTDVVAFEPGTGWSGLPLGGLVVQPEAIAASDGRVVVSDYALGVVLREPGGALTTDPAVPAARLTAADGVFFAVNGRLVRREAGAGWEPIDTDALPLRWNSSRALHADGPSTLWIGVHLPGEGALARWDGSGWILAARGLPDAPSWLGRLADGALYAMVRLGEVGQSATLHRVEGSRLVVVPDMPPDLGRVHRLADGTWYVVAGIDDVHGDVSRVLRRRAGEAAWVEVVRSDDLVQLAGSGDRVWITADGLGWSEGSCSGP